MTGETGLLHIEEAEGSHEIRDEKDQDVATLYYHDIGRDAAAKYAKTFVAAANKLLRRRESAKVKKGDGADA